jgi:succinate dehydrogenase / fumarate reductase, cytochrome b subunit
VKRSEIGKKALMATSGFVLFVFVVAHALGNLQVYLGATRLDAYAQFLRATPSLLWGTRVVLTLAIGIHAVLGVRLARESAAARPIRYATRTSFRATFSSRTMIWSGLLIFAFILYHLLHLTVGVAHPSFEHGHVYHNVVVGLRVVPASVAYVVSMLALGVHLNHGLWSMFQSIGVSHPRLTTPLRRAATLVATLIVLSNVSIPAAILVGLVGS